MSTIATPILRDNSLSSVSVTGLFRGGSTYIRNGSFHTVVADDANIDELTVTNLIVSGTVTGTTSDVDLGLSPNQLVATNAAGAPISFPYGDSAGQIVRRDANGSASFTSWVTPSTDTQFFFSTGFGQGIACLFNGVVDTVVTLPDVGADANLVVYGNNNLKNVIPSGDNILHLKSTDAAAIVALSGPSVATTRTQFEWQINGTVAAKLVHETDTKQLSLRDNSDIVRFLIIPDATTPQIRTGQPLVPFSNDTWDLSNGNFASFKHLFLVSTSGAAPVYGGSFTLDSAGVSVITFPGDTLTPTEVKSVTWNNSFITSTTRFLLNVIALAGGAPNAATVGVPHPFISAVTPGSCQLSIGNIGTVNNTTAFTVGVVMFP